jgi:hypothetical protein
MTSHSPGWLCALASASRSATSLATASSHNVFMSMPSATLRVRSPRATSRLSRSVSRCRLPFERCSCPDRGRSPAGCDDAGDNLANFLSSASRADDMVEPQRAQGLTPNGLFDQADFPNLRQATFDYPQTLATLSICPSVHVDMCTCPFFHLCICTLGQVHHGPPFPPRFSIMATCPF